MNKTIWKILLWLPRILGILFVLFTSIFSLDIFDMGLGFWGTLVGLLMHLLFPSIALAVVIAFAWRWEWVGALGFGLWAIFYLFRFRGFDVTVYLLMTGIPVLIAILYLAGWLLRKEIRG